VANHAVADPRAAAAYDPDVTAILGGVASAAFIAIATLCSARSSRLIPATSVLAWVMLTGLIVLLPVLFTVSAPQHLDGPAIAWLLIAGGGNVAGLLLAYSALRIGRVGIVAPILSTEGAVAATISLLAGESPGAASLWLLVVIIVGVTLAAVAPDRLDTTARLRPVLFATISATAFGLSLYAAGRQGATLSAAWVLLPARLIGVAAITLPLLLRRRLQLTRAAAPLVLTSGVCEVLGLTSYVLGARHALATAAVLSSQFGAFAGIGAFLLFRERLNRAQLCGVLVIVIGVSALSGIRG
jgi:drug/metabolite transporter (DMT)-like permease